MENWRWCVAELVFVAVFACVCLPEDFAITAQGGKEDFVVVVKRDNQPFAVPGWGGRGMGVFLVHFGCEGPAVHDGLPELFSGVTMKANDGLCLCLLIGGCQENLVSNHNG